MSHNNTAHINGLVAISPIAVFLLFYLAVSLIVGDFYKMPIAVALMVASAWAVVIMRGTPLSKRVEIFSRDAGSSNVMYMIWIFLLAGAFASLAKEIGAVEATVNLALKHLPAEMIIPGLFFAACFISLSIGTSVGTVVALAPLTVELAQSESGSIPFFVATVLSGAFFGDNLSFISDTTIAATRSQGCDMADKFRANIWLALPAAAVTLAVYLVENSMTPVAQVADAGHPSVWLVLPYLMVIVAAVARMNVTLVLSGGIVAAMVVGMAHGHSPLSLCGFMGSGIESMGGLIVVTLMSAGMLGLVKANGGIDWMLQVLTARVRGKRGAQGCIALLVSLVNLCTANNTVAIITVGPLSKEISRRFSITPRKSASLLDTCSCIVQCLIPYGAQTLLACSLAGLSPAEPFRYLYYPWALAVAVIVSIMVKGGRK